MREAEHRVLQPLDARDRERRRAGGRGGHQPESLRGALVQPARDGERGRGGEEPRQAHHDAGRLRRRARHGERHADDERPRDLLHQVGGERLRRQRPARERDRAEDEALDGEAERHREPGAREDRLLRRHDRVSGRARNRRPGRHGRHGRHRRRRRWPRRGSGRGIGGHRGSGEPYRIRRCHRQSHSPVPTAIVLAGANGKGAQWTLRPPVGSAASGIGPNASS